MQVEDLFHFWYWTTSALMYYMASTCISVRSASVFLVVRLNVRIHAQYSILLDTHCLLMQARWRLSDTARYSSYYLWVQVPTSLLLCTVHVIPLALFPGATYTGSWQTLLRVNRVRACMCRSQNLTLHSNPATLLHDMMSCLCQPYNHK